ncbi:MAG: hypothetical protein Q8K57_03780 [Thiobacillus sp.]|nr:hypothetical protein [Thiobacillus sp.]MDP1923887.1 hypothetical protein [Thiobacillus sp.]MDP3126554.1 hypothetical protein [Thiobacillus sp.]
MDWLTFVSKLIDSLAWPLVALVLGLVFRRKLLDLIPAIRKFKAGPLEAEFELAAKEIRVNAAEVSAKSEPTKGGEQEEQREEGKKDIVDTLLSARNDPSGMILEGWSKVDGELFRLGLQLGDIADPLISTTKVYESVMGSGVLPLETTRLVRELRDLRNKVAHVKVVPTSDAAQDYVLAVDRVIKLIHNYRKNLPNYRPTIG